MVEGELSHAGRLVFGPFLPLASYVGLVSRRAPSFRDGKLHRLRLLLTVVIGIGPILVRTVYLSNRMSSQRVSFNMVLGCY